MVNRMWFDLADLHVWLGGSRADVDVEDGVRAGTDDQDLSLCQRQNITA